jgi:hypothetical protein
MAGEHIITVGLNPLIRISLSLIRSDIGTHLTISLSSFSYYMHWGLSVANPEERNNG